MSDSEIQTIILSTLSKLESKLDILSGAVGELKTEVALLKRDKAWSKWIVGVISSTVTFALGVWIRKI